MKNNNEFFYAIMLFCILLCGCVADERSYKIKDEKIVMKIKEDPSLFSKKLPSQEIASRGLATDIIGKGVSIAVSGVKNLIENDKKKYTADYKTGLSNMYFYKNPSLRGPYDPEGMQFNGYDFVRTFDNDGKIDTALYLSVSIDKSNKYDIVNNFIFRLKVDKLILNFSKAKINGLYWYYPWTYIFANSKKKHINMDIKITITGTWINEQQELFQDKTLGEFYLTLRNMPVDTSSEEYKKYYESVKGTLLKGISFLPVRSYGYYYDEDQNLNKCWGQGLYSVWVSFTESSEENFYSTTLRNSSGDILDNIEEKFIKPDDSKSGNDTKKNSVKRK